MPTQRPPVLRFARPEVILDYRRTHGVNQTAFWGKVGVTQSGGSRYESGREIPVPIQVMLQLAYGTPTEAAELLAWLRSPEEGIGPRVSAWAPGQNYVVSGSSSGYVTGVSRPGY